MGSLSLLQEISPTQGSNPGLPNDGQILYQLSYEGSPYKTHLGCFLSASPVPHSSVQFSSVAQLCLTLCNPMDCSTSGFLVHHQLLEFTQTHVQWITDAIQPSHPLSSPSPAFKSFPASGFFLMSQLFASGGQSIGVSASTSVLPKNTQD